MGSGGNNADAVPTAFAHPGMLHTDGERGIMAALAAACGARRKGSGAAV
ncbi:hypothetical protein AB0D59_46355 [Streptomyces sp. NPDC048417]